MPGDNRIPVRPATIIIIDIFAIDKYWVLFYDVFGYMDTGIHTGDFRTVGLIAGLKLS